MYDWIYYVCLGLTLFLTALSFTAPSGAKDDQSEYTGNNPNLPVMKNPPQPPLRSRPKMEPNSISEDNRRPKTPPAPNPKPNV